MPRTAVLVRRQRIEVGDVSRKGCRLEGPEPLAIGAVGMLSVNIDGLQHVELFRVSRGGPLPGGDHLFEAGVEFLPMPAGTPSLHDVAAVLDDVSR
jgi:hypothetical protein